MVQQSRPEHGLVGHLNDKIDGHEPNTQRLKFGGKFRKIAGRVFSIRAQSPRYKKERPSKY